ncbi:GMC oxidoreductase [Xylariomycetidae sp. FL0641]|nr:GMC oxidoreductase [Xylariomycetidae sp. FL0641]
MPLHETFVDELREVDVIIAGGGTAGCVVAGRLAEADPSLSILVIEAGGDNYNLDKVVTPAQFPLHLRPDSDTTLFYKATKSTYLADRECVVPAGGVLGGGSSINFMMYTRAQRDDYDSWNMPGWSAEELLPYMKKLETYHGPDPASQHGTAGPIHVSLGSARQRQPHVEDDFLRAAARVGWRFQRWPKYTSPDGRGARRSDAAHAYLHPRLRDGGHANLHVLVRARAVRVRLDDADRRARGVELALASPSRDTVTVTARRLVVLACGACGSPGVLERSGIGGAAALRRAGVAPVAGADLPGVGRAYHDHHLLLCPYRTALRPHESLDELLQGRVGFAEARARGDPRLGWTAIDVAGRLRPSAADVADLGPEFRAVWNREFRDRPGRPLMFMALLYGFFGDPASIAPGTYASVGSFTAYPFSRGHIHITGRDLDDPLDFDVGFFSDEHDIDAKALLWAYKKGREIMRRTSFYRGEVAAHHPPFAPGSGAACCSLDRSLLETTEGGLEAIRDLEYSAEDDEVIVQFLRENVNTTWHSLGTAKMAPRGEMGVVDQDLNVYGVGGLKVADVSICPQNVGANTNHTALVIGEKAADIIVKELGLG